MLLKTSTEEKKNQEGEERENETKATKEKDARFRFSTALCHSKVEARQASHLLWDFEGNSEYQIGDEDESPTPSEEFPSDEFDVEAMSGSTSIVANRGSAFSVFVPRRVILYSTIA